MSFGQLITYSVRLVQRFVLDFLGVPVTKNPAFHFGSILDFVGSCLFYRFLETFLGGSLQHVECHRAPKWEAVESKLWGNVLDPCFFIVGYLYKENNYLLRSDVTPNSTILCCSFGVGFRQTFGDCFCRFVSIWSPLGRQFGSPKGSRQRV